MNTGQAEKIIHDFFRNVDDNIKDSQKVKQLFDNLDSSDIKILEDADREHLQELLVILLKLISSASGSTALASCDRVLLYLKKIPLIFDAFKPNKDLLKQLNFKRLLTSPNSEIVYDLMIFIMRYYSDVDYEDFDLGARNKDILVKEEKKRVWLTLDHVLIKLDTFMEEFRNRTALTAKALGEIFAYKEGLKKSVNESRMRSSMEGDRDRSAEMGNGSNSNNFVDRKDFDNLKKEINALKESMVKSKDGSGGGGPEFFKEKESKKLENKLTDVPKAYLMDGMTTEVRDLKSRVNKAEMLIEGIEKLTNKLSDGKQSKMTELEKKVADDLESFKLFKERVQIEVDLLKERASHNLRSSIQEGATNPLGASTFQPSGGPALKPDDYANQHSIDTLAKVHENFKRDTVLNLNKLNSLVAVMQKRLGVMERTGGEGDDQPVRDSRIKDKNSKDKSSLNPVDEDRINKFEERAYEQEVHFKKSIFELKKEMIERIDLINNAMEDMRARGGVQNSKDTSGNKTTEKAYENFMASDKRREMDDFLKAMKKEMDARFTIAEKDIGYLSEVQKYLSSVGFDHLGCRDSQT